MKTEVAVEFETSAYEFAHGHAPRGRGGWAFALTRYPASVAGWEVFWAQGTFSEAKATARRFFREVGRLAGEPVVYVTVLS